MTNAEILGLLAFVALVAFAAVLAVAETSLTHLSRGRAAALAEDGDKRAAMLARLLERRERVINPVLLVLLTCPLGAATIVARIPSDRWGPTGVVLAFVVELIVIFVLAEAVPKTYALLATDQAALRVAPLARAIALIAPLRWAARLLIGAANVIIPGKGRAEGPTVTEDDLLALAGVAVDDAVLAAEERKLIENTIEFGDTVVREVMVPRPDMVTVSSDFKVGDVMEIVILNGFSRLPVSGDGIDDIVGIVHAKDLMRAERDDKSECPVTDYLRPAIFVPETKKVPPLLREMQAQRYHMAIVIDEYGGTAGLVTLEDLIEELVGEIVDEYDVEDLQLERLPTGELRVNARMNIDDLNELLDAELPEGDWDSVGGLLIALLGHVPAEGEAAEVDGHQLRAERVNGRRIGRVVIGPATR
ncbi:MAG: magnesium and cobalt exporter, family [Acidimicrobiaceae bacterium]